MNAQRQTSAKTDRLRRVQTRRLTPADAGAIARLEDETYPAELRAGRRALEADITDADLEDCNLGMGLFDGEALVGFFLLYYEPDSRRLFDYFGVTRPPDLIAEECLYVADFVVRRPYSRYMWRLLADSMSLFSGYYGLPMLAFSAQSALDRWLARRKAFARFGYAYAGARRFELEAPPHETFLVRFEPSFEDSDAPANSLTGLRVQAVQSRLGWRKLATEWDALVRKSPDATAFQSFEWQSIWWDHYGADSRLWILVVRDGSTIRAIAPLRIVGTRYYGRFKRLVKFIGDYGEMDRPTVLRDGDDHEAVKAVFDYLLAHRDVWDLLMFYEQPAGGVVLTTAEKLLPAELLVGVLPGPLCPWIDLRGGWDAFLASKSRGFRKSLRRKLAQLKARGAVSFSTRETWPDVEQAFEDYLDVERRSWKPSKNLGVAKSAVSLAYHRALVETLGPSGRIIVRTLILDGAPIAATFGVLDRGQYLSLHITHDRACDAYSPGVLLTAYELEECYGRADHESFELLGGFLDNKTTWMSNARETRQLYAYRRELMFAIHYAWHFRVEPYLKRLAKRAGVFPFALAVKARLRKLIFGSERPPA